MRLRDIYLRLHKSLNVVRSVQAKINGSGGFTVEERAFVYEALFARVFREYENFLEDAFVSYMVGEPAVSGRRIEAVVVARDREHARKLLIGSSPFLDWTKPTVVRDRCLAWFNDPDERFYTGIVSSASAQGHAKDLRNHISHNSIESSIAYEKLVTTLHVVMPIDGMHPGEFLQTIPTKGPSKDKEVLEYFISSIDSAARYIAEVSP